jgi:hypothetical protein
VALVLTTLLGYGFSPSIAAFRRVLTSRAQAVAHGARGGASAKSPAE